MRLKQPYWDCNITNLVMAITCFRPEKRSTGETFVRGRVEPGEESLTSALTELHMVEAFRTRSSLDDLGKLMLGLPRLPHASRKPIIIRGPEVIIIGFIAKVVGSAVFSAGNEAVGSAYKLSVGKLARALFVVAAAWAERHDEITGCRGMVR